MSEEVKKTEDKKSESENSNSRYKGKGPNKDNRQKRGPELVHCRSPSLLGFRGRSHFP